MTKEQLAWFANYIKSLPVKQFGAGEREDMATMVAELAAKEDINFDKVIFFLDCGLTSFPDFARCFDDTY